MKSYIPLSCLLATVSAIALERRQTPKLSPYSGKSPSIKAIKAETLKPTVDYPNVKRLKLTYGPFKLKGAGSSKKEGNGNSLDPQGTAYQYVTADFPTGITILSGYMSIRLADGNAISNSNGVYNHHVFLLDLNKGGKSNLKCEGSTGSIPNLPTLFASAADAGSAIPANVTNKPVTGRFVDKGHKILFTLDLVNYNQENREVNMVTEIQYVEGKATGLYEPSLQLVSVDSCDKKKGSGGLILTQPLKGQKQLSLKGDRLIVTQDTRILALRGHMHDGGVNMVFRINGKDVCNSTAIYNAAAVSTNGDHGGHADGGHSDGGMLSDMSSCAKGIDVKQGDKISMEAYYDLEKHPAREHPGGGMSEGMALMVVIFGKKIT